MAHDHRMNPVGEPHLNAVRRQPQGRSDLPRLTRMVSRQLASEAGVTQKEDPYTKQLVIDTHLSSGAKAFSPPSGYFHRYVSERLANYRQARNSGSPNLPPSQSDSYEITDRTSDVANELNIRFKGREGYDDWKGQW